MTNDINQADRGNASTAQGDTAPRHFGPVASEHPPDVSLVVSTIGRPDSLRRMIRSIEAELDDELTVELIVIDQSGGDETLQMLEETPLAVPCRHARSGIGVSAGRNAGWRLANGQYVLFPDDDVWFEGGLIRAAVNYLDQHPDVVGYSARVTSDDGSDTQLRWSQRSQFIGPRNYHRTSIGPAVFFRLTALEDANGFDETIGTGSPGWYGACEDSDLVLRTIESGSKIWYEPSPVLHHREVRWDEGDEVETKSLLYGCGQGHLWRTRDFAMPWVAFMILRRLVGSVTQFLRGRSGVGRVQRAWVRGAICGLFDRRPHEVRVPTQPEPEPSETRSPAPTAAEFVISFKWRILMSAAGLVGTFGLTVVAARALPDGDLAVFLVLLVALSFGPSLGRLGLNQQAVQQLGKARASEGTEDTVQLAHDAVRMCLAPSLLAGPAIAIFVASIGSGSFLFSWLMITVVLTTESLRLTYSDVLMGLGMPRWSAVLSHGIRAVAVLGVVVGDRLIFSSELGLTRLLAMMALVGVGLTAIGHFRLAVIPRTQPKGERRLRPSWVAVQAGLPFLVVDVVGILIARGDVWLSSLAFEERSAVVYSTASTLAALAGTPVGLANVALAPIVAGYLAQGRRKALEQLVRRVTTVLALLLVPAVIVTIVWGDWILELAFGERFAAGHSLLVILMLGNVGSVVFGLGSVVLVMAGYQKLAMWLAAGWIVVLVPVATAVALIGGSTPLAIVSALGSTGLLVLLSVGAWITTGIRVHPTTQLSPTSA